MPQIQGVHHLRDNPTMEVRRLSVGNLDELNKAVEAGVADSKVGGMTLASACSECGNYKKLGFLFQEAEMLFDVQDAEFDTEDEDKSEPPAS